LTEVINSHNPDSGNIAADVLIRGGVVVYPTETLYGIAASAMDEGAVDRVFEIKGRPKDMAIPLLVRDLSMLSEVAEVNYMASALARRFWPGALTLILNERGVLPKVITAGTGKVAVRISGHEFVKSLFYHFNQPITSTSANISGGKNLTHFDDIQKEFSGRVDLIIDSGNIPPSRGSTVLDITVNPPEIVRPGDIKEEEIKEYI
jgi:L-threonylcarbamoyladenylate synthase